MEIWGWVAGYVVLFALLHLGLYYYYVRRNGAGQSSSPSLTDRDYAGTRSASRSDAVSGPSEEADSGRERQAAHRRSPGSDPEVDPDRNIDPDYDGETVRCAQCGVVNEADQTYTFCWNCVSTLQQ